LAQLSTSQVPDTETFSLQDVVDEVNPSTNDLVECFADANADYFHTFYKDTYYVNAGNKNNLLMFRDYGQVTGDYGLLYNYAAAKNSNFAPADWRVPTQLDYSTLVQYLGGNEVAGGKMKETGYVHWQSPNSDATNSSGFNAFGGGILSNGGEFTAYATRAAFATQTGASLGGVEALSLYHDRDAAYFISGENQDDWGMSIRLVYTGSGSPQYVQDYDGNVYEVVQIGTQYWTKTNWACTHLDDGTQLTRITNAADWDDAQVYEYYYTSYGHDLRRATIPQYQEGITSSPTAHLWQYNEYGSPVAKVFTLTIIPDAAFSVSVTNSEHFQVNVSQTNNTITVYPKTINDTGQIIDGEIQVTASGYDTEILTLTHVNQL